MGKTSPVVTTEQEVGEEIQTFPPSKCNAGGTNTSCVEFIAGTHCLTPAASTRGPKSFQEVFQQGDSVSCIILLAPLPGSHEGQVQTLVHSNT